MRLSCDVDVFSHGGTCQFSMLHHCYSLTVNFEIFTTTANHISHSSATRAESLKTAGQWKY